MTTIQNPQRTLELAAQGLANLGKKDPQLTTASFGALQLRDREGNVISTLDYRTPLNRAWLQALQALSEQGIDISKDWAQKPFLAQLKTSSDDTQNLGIYITPEKLVVKAWLHNIDWLTDTDDDANAIIPEGAICPFTPYSAYIQQSNLNWDGTSKVATVKSNCSIYSEHQRWTKIGELTAGTTVKACATTETSGSISIKYITPGYTTQYLYPLETPIEIPFDSPLNFDFPRVSDTDILCVLDIDGEEMFRIQSGEVDEAYCTRYNLPSDLATKGALWTDLFPNPEWVKSHNTLPGLLILDNLRGIGRRFDVKYLLSLETRLQALEDKLK